MVGEPIMLGETRMVVETIIVGEPMVEEPIMVGEPIIVGEPIMVGELIMHNPNEAMLSSYQTLRDLHSHLPSTQRNYLKLIVARTETGYLTIEKRTFLPFDLF